MRLQSWLLAFLILTITICAPPLKAEEVLTNDAVLGLHQAGLPAEIIAAKVKQATEVAFTLETEDLVALQEAGLPTEVITAMLERATESNEAAEVPNPVDEMRENLGFEVVRAKLVTSEGAQKLRLARGEFSTAGMGYVTFMNYAGLHARTRTNDARPILHVESHEQLTGGRFFLVKLDVDEDDGVRSLKISSARNRFRAMFGRSSQMMEPDQDWVIEWTSIEIGEDLWEVKPSKDLPAGEYGLYVDRGATAQGGGLFGFGVGRIPAE